MLEQYFCNVRVLKRMQESYLAVFFEDYVKYLYERGHSPSTIVHYCKYVEHFGYWLAKNKISIHAINKKVIQHFLKRHLLRCQCPPPNGCNISRARPPLRQLLKFCIKKEICHGNDEKIVQPYDKLLNEYDDYLDTICGLVPITRITRKRYIDKFLKKNKIFNYRGIKKLMPRQVKQFILQYAKYCKQSTVHYASSSLRSFFRFLQFKGCQVKYLIAAIPHFLHWSLSEIPTYFDEKQLHLLLKSFDRSTPTGKRNYAITCCFVYLGLRCSEVVTLKLNDINWHEGSLTLLKNKSRCAKQLPLPQPLANALSDYIQYGRVKTASKFVFVHHCAPLGEGISRATIYELIKRGCLNAGLPMLGTHIFRTCLASQMLKNGATIKEISDILRHRNINTTMIYTKIDLAQLSQVAMPWVGEEHE